MFYIEISVFLVLRHIIVFFFELYYLNMMKHRQADHPSDTFAGEEGKLRFKFWRENVRVTEKQLISAQ